MSLAKRVLYSPILLVACFFALLILILGASRFGHTQSEISESIQPLLVETLGQQGHTVRAKSERFIGRVEARQRVEVGFDISSVVDEIYISEGEFFERGELLATLDTKRLLARQKELGAQAARSLAARELAQASLKRAEGLKVNGNISDQALDEARQRRDSAFAEHDLVLAQQRSIDVELNKSKLVAPFNGVVIDRMSDEGKTATPGVPILLLEQTGLPEIRVSLPLKLARTLNEGAEVFIHHPQGGFSGNVERINLSLSTARVSEVYVAPDPGEQQLVSGEILMVEFAQAKVEQGIWLPIAALSEFGRGLWSVYIAEPNGEDGMALIRRSVVEVVQIRGESALVAGGIVESDVPNVVKASTHRIVSGQQVRINTANHVTKAL